MKTALSGALIVFVASLQARASNVLARVSGDVRVTPAGIVQWNAAINGMEIVGGDRVQTGRRGECEIHFDDGSKVFLGPKSNYELRPDKDKLSMTLSLGTLRALVKNITGKGFSVRTPTALAAIRGTDFRVTVNEGGQSVFDLYSGLIGVSDDKGNEKLIKPGERIQVDERGLGPVVPITKALEGQRQQQAEALKRDVGLNMSKEQVLAGAAEEIKLAEYQAGKAIIDVFGNRVRLEQYILRPRADQFKLVVLNERSDRFDYFFFLGTFNQNLPADLSLALSGLGGQPFTPPQWYLTAYETGRSNTQDDVHELASGGHLVDVNHGPDPDAFVTTYFDTKLNRVVTLGPSDPFYETLFDNYSIAYDGLVTFSWSGTNIQSTKSVVATYYGGSGNYLIDTEFPDFPLLHQRVKESYGNGSVFDQYDNYLVDDSGTSASINDFAGVTAGPAYKASLLKWNFEQVITSSQFGGRKIDLVVEPKTLIQSGLIP